MQVTSVSVCLRNSDERLVEFWRQLQLDDGKTTQLLPRSFTPLDNDRYLSHSRSI